MAHPVTDTVEVGRALLDDDVLFGILRDEVIPQAVARNTDSRMLAIWSAGCANGSELYAIAALLDTHFPELSGWLVTLYGNDASGEAVAAARAGRVSVDAGRADGAAVDFGAHSTVRELRRRCFFEEFDLCDEWPALPVFDLVVCRGVLDAAPAASAGILARFQRRLAPGGHVVLGTAESLLNAGPGYRRERYGDRSVFRFTA
jgi:chemotaxis protein methyltransferase CheR